MSVLKRLTYVVATLLIVGMVMGYSLYTNARDKARFCAQLNAMELRAIDGAQAEAAMDWHLHKDDYAKMDISREEAERSTREYFIEGARSVRAMMEERSGIVCK